MRAIVCGAVCAAGNIVMGIFEVAQTVVNNAAGVIIADTAIDLESIITNIEERLFTILKTLAFQPCGVAPTTAATSATCSLMESNIPDRLLIIPPTSSSLSHSVIFSQRKFKERLLLYISPSRWDGRGRG